MALPAPKSAYIDLMVKTGTTEADAKLTELAIANVDEATLKSRFYLDKTLSGIYNGVYVFIGGCIVGSDNYYMHNLNRIGSTKGTQIGNVVYFADAGLNTLGKPTILSNDLQWANYIRSNIRYLSAYYGYSDNVGLRYRAGTGAWHEVWFNEGIAQAASLTGNRVFSSAFTKGTTIEVQPLIQNGEGVKDGVSILVTLKAPIYEYDAIKRTSSCNSSGQVFVGLWMTQDFLDGLSYVPEGTSTATGLYMYKDVEQTTKADSGWYFGFREDKSFFVDGNGQVTHYEICTESRGIIILSIEDSGEGTYAPLMASISTAWTAQDVVISGRLDTHPTNATGDGVSFSITILAGETFAMDWGVSLPTNKQWYWQNVSTNPTGFVIQLSPI